MRMPNHSASDGPAADPFFAGFRAFLAGPKERRAGFAPSRVAGQAEVVAGDFASRMAVAPTGRMGVAADSSHLVALHADRAGALVVAAGAAADVAPRGD